MTSMSIATHSLEEKAEYGFGLAGHHVKPHAALEQYHASPREFRPAPTRTSVLQIVEAARV